MMGVWLVSYDGCFHFATMMGVWLVVCYDGCLVSNGHYDGCLVSEVVSVPG